MEKASKIRPLPIRKKNIDFIDILVWISTIHAMGMTNINFIFDKIHPCEREVSERDRVRNRLYYKIHT